MPSFYSERTAEYSLTPKFLDLLKPLGFAVPIHFSGKREDTLVSLDSHSGESFHLVAFFARRPKIDYTGSLNIQGKINRRLFRVAKFASQFGIPTLCGISLTNNIFGQSCAEPLWFDISNSEIESDLVFSCEIHKNLTLKKYYGQMQPTSNSEIISRIANSRVLDWSEVMLIMRELPRLADDSIPSRFMFLSQVWRLRPLYFVIRRK